MTNADIKRFTAYLKAAGAEILITTNIWEVIRFKANNEVGIIYKNSKGNFTFVGIAEEAASCFYAKKVFVVKEKNTASIWAKSVKVRTLLARDGENCFYCGQALNEDITVEHFLSKNCGGTNHINNLVLAHKKCNLTASHLNVMDKVKLRDQLSKEQQHGDLSF